MKTGRTLSALRCSATSFGRLWVSEARRASEKPMAFSMRRFSASAGRPCSRMRASMSTIAFNWAMNHGSILQASWTSFSVMPRRSAWATWRRRSGVGVPITARMALWSSPSPRPGISISSRPVRPVSIPRRAFCSDSAKVRPIAMTSPTDFIAVVRTGEAPGNFSKAKRGIFVTT
ncbi:hypothetical protein D3C80_1247630 [compost metagenome]